VRYVVKAGDGPPPGYQPIPGGHSGGYRKRRAGRWVYWYPTKRVAGPSPPAGGDGNDFYVVRDKLFRGDGVRVFVKPDSPDPVAFAREHLPGTDIRSLEDFARIVGAPPGSTVSVEVLPESGLDKRPSIEVFFHRGSGELGGVRRLAPVDPDDRSKGSEIVNEAFAISEEATGTGLGTRMFASQVAAAQAAGFKRIRCEALRGSGYNGYYTWARLGYLPPSDDRGVRQVMDGARHGVGLPPDVEAAYGEGRDARAAMVVAVSTEAGRTWWKAYGNTFRAEFDLTPGGYSSRLLVDYAAREKAHLWKAAADLQGKVGIVEELTLTPEQEKLLDATWSEIGTDLLRLAGVVDRGLVSRAVVAASLTGVAARGKIFARVGACCARGGNDGEY